MHTVKMCSCNCGLRTYEENSGPLMKLVKDLWVRAIALRGKYESLYLETRMG